MAVRQPSEVHVAAHGALHLLPAWASDPCLRSDRSRPCTSTLAAPVAPGLCPQTSAAPDGPDSASAGDPAFGIMVSSFQCDLTGKGRLEHSPALLSLPSGSLGGCVAALCTRGIAQSAVHRREADATSQGAPPPPAATRRRQPLLPAAHRRRPRWCVWTTASSRATATMRPRASRHRQAGRRSG